MTLRKKIYLLIISSLVIFLASLFIFNEIQLKQNNLMMRSASEQQDLIINNEINRRSDDLKQIVTDYTNWDDLIDNLNTKNQVCDKYPSGERKRSALYFRNTFGI